jgi:RNA polymerase sigma factor (sigma-70 family)
MEPVVEATAVDPDPPPDETAARSESRERLRRAVLALPEELRSVVTAHYWGEVPVAEIAKQEGMTPPGVRKRLARAFAAIQAALEGK